jgi:hypothetical protein
MLMQKPAPADTDFAGYMYDVRLDKKKIENKLKNIEDKLSDIDDLTYCRAEEILDRLSYLMINLDRYASDLESKCISIESRLTVLEKKIP